jgi:hypothetical protein
MEERELVHELVMFVKCVGDHWNKKRSGINTHPR